MSKKLSRNWQPGHFSRGFTLVELMVSMALSLVVLGVAGMLFDKVFDLSETVVLIAETNQNLRAGMNLVARDLIAAGGNVPIGGIPMPNGAGSSSILRPGPNVVYFPANGGALSSVTPAYQYNTTTFAGLQSDAITILSVDPLLTPLDDFPLVSVANVTSPAGWKIKFNAATVIGATPAPVAVNDLIMLTNVNGSALAVVTAIDGVGNTVTFSSGDPLGYNQTAAANGTISNLQTAGTPPFYPPTIATKLAMVTYLLDVTTNPAHPRLMRQIGYSTASAVALDIYKLQFTYDLSDGTTTNQTSVTALNQIRKVNIFMAARSPNISRRTRGYYNTMMSSAVSVRNLEYVNKY